MREKQCLIHSNLRTDHYYFGSYATYASSRAKSSQTCTLPEGGVEQANVSRSIRSYCDKRSRTVLDVTRDVDIDEAKSRCHSLKARRARPPGGSNVRRRLCGAAPVIYCGAVEALVGYLSRGMLSGDGIWWVGCDRAHLGGVSRDLVVMQEGRTAISRRPSVMRKPRLVVEDGDLVQRKHRRKSLRASSNPSS